MPFDIFGAAYTLFKDFGFGFLEFCIIMWLLYKIANNHLRHLKSDIHGVSVKIDVLSTSVTSSIKNLDDKINETHCKVDEISERVSKVEGKIG